LNKEDIIYQQVIAIASSYGIFDCIPCARAIKEFLISDDNVALRLRRHLGDDLQSVECHRSLFDIAVNLEECWQYPTEQRLTAIKHLLANDKNSEIAILDLANSLVQKLSEIL